MGFWGIQDTCNFIARDMGYYLFYFKGHGVLCSIFVLTFMGYM